MPEKTCHKQENFQECFHKTQTTLLTHGYNHSNSNVQSFMLDHFRVQHKPACICSAMRIDIKILDLNKIADIYTKQGPKYLKGPVSKCLSCPKVALQLSWLITSCAFLTVQQKQYWNKDTDFKCFLFIFYLQLPQLRVSTRNSMADIPAIFSFIPYLL